MGNMTLSIPERLHSKMRKHTELRWSDVARKAFEKKLKELDFMEKLLEKSQLTEDDAERIGHKIKARLRKRLG